MRLDSILSVPFWPSRWFQPQAPLHYEQSSVAEPFEWDQIEPSKTFQWTSCLGDFQCARLQVPMDWQGTSSEANRTVEIAVIKLAATVPITDSTYGGAVVFNPGGPGGSGISQVLLSGHDYRTVISAGPDSDNSTARHFDIIGFDPRGVNNTRPHFTCFPDHLAASAFAIEELVTGWVDTTPTSFDNLWAMKRAQAKGCSERGVKEGFVKHMSTAAVARDIIEIVERHGEWREKEAERLLKLPTNSHLTATERGSILDRTSYHAGHEMVQYWGFSYGTLLGGTLTAMYPDRVKRVVLDGVVDMQDYMASGWTTNLRDTDRQLALFGEYCYDGGEEHCAVFDPAGPSAIVANIQTTLTTLQHSPLPVPGTDTSPPTFVTYNDFQALVWRRVVYNPMALFPETAQILSDLSRSNGTSLALLKLKSRSIPSASASLSERCKSEGPYSYPCIKPHLDSSLEMSALYAIACGDGLPRTSESKSSFREYSDLLASQSSLIGAFWATIMMPCTAWNARPHWRYDGDFSTPETAHPILFVGNSVDPVTPLRNAVKMAGYFGGSAVVHQGSEGHCSNSAMSMCTAKAIRKYFQSGELPDDEGGVLGRKGRRCEPDLRPLGGYAKDSEVPGLPEGEKDEAMWKALVGMNRAFVA